MKAIFQMCIYASCLQNFVFHVYKWNGLFREDADLNLTDTTSPAVPGYFPKECVLVFMRQSPSRVHLQSVTAALQQRLLNRFITTTAYRLFCSKIVFSLHSTNGSNKKSKRAQDVSLTCLAAISHLRAGCCSGTWCPCSSAPAQVTSGHCSSCFGTRFGPNASSLAFHSL